MAHFKTILKEVKAFIFDVDGVLSGNHVILHPEGDLMRSMNIKDGYALHRAVEAGFPIGIITGAASDSIVARFNKLGITDVYLNSFDKIEPFKDFYFKYHLDPKTIVYMGDDIPDLVVMNKVGMPVCPSDAVEEVKLISKYISHQGGGQGCVRDIIEQVLRAQNLW